MGKSFKELDLSNAFLFAAALSDADTCRLVLEIILGEKLPPVSVHAEHMVFVSSDFTRVAMKMPCLHEYLRSTAITREIFEVYFSRSGV